LGESLGLNYYYLRLNFDSSSLLGRRPLQGYLHRLFHVTIPGLTSLLSSVSIPFPSKYEYPVGLLSTPTKFRLQLPYENGFGGAGPGTSVLCA